MSRRLDIRDEIITALNIDLPVDIPPATKRRWIPGNVIREAAIAVFFVNEDVAIPGNSRGPVARRSLRVAVQCINACDTPDQMDDSIEPLISHAIARLGDLHSAKIMQMTELESKWESGIMDRIYIAGSIVFNVDYQTKRDNLDTES